MGVDTSSLLARPLVGLDIALVALALVAVAALASRPGPSVTSYGQLGSAAGALVLVAAATLPGAAAAAAAVGGDRRLVASLVVAGVAWTGEVATGWSGGPLVVRSAAAVLAPLLPAALLHLALARAATGRAQAVTTIAGLLSGSMLAISAGRALVYDPFLDRHCWANCVGNTFVVWADRQVAADLLGVERVLAAAAAIGVIGVSLREASLTTALGRRRSLPVLGPLMAAGLAEALRAVTLLVEPAEDPRSPWSIAVFAVRAGALVLVAAGAVTVATLDARRHRAVASLARSLAAGASGGTFESSLQASLDDASVRVAYALPSGQLVDGDGRTTDLAPTGNQVVTTIARSEEPLAYVVHDRSVGIGSGLGAAARLAIDNERLKAGALAHLSDLVASRARIVAASDRARRDLERDLHDGVQQHVVALSFRLRMAAAAARRHDDATVVAALDDALADTQVVLGELRSLAHGIFPAVLVEAGLLPALRTLALASPIPLEVDGEPPGPMTPEGLMAAYFAVVTWIESQPETADHLQVTVGTDEPSVVLGLVSASSDEASEVPLAVADRVGAVGGSVRTDGRVVRVELPCVS